MGHHKVEYPVSKLLRPAPYVGAGGAGAFEPFIEVTHVFSFALFRQLGLTRAFCATFAAWCVAFTLASDYLHGQYHVEGSWLERYGWFMRRRRHHHHHGKHLENMSLGGLSNVWDRTVCSAGCGGRPDSSRCLRSVSIVSKGGCICTF